GKPRKNHLVGVEPDAEIVGHLPGHAVLGGPQDNDDHLERPIDKALPRPGLGRDIAEKGHALTIKARGDLDGVVGKGGDQPGVLSVGRRQQGEEYSNDDKESSHRATLVTAMEKTSVRSRITETPQRMAT